MRPLILAFMELNGKVHQAGELATPLRRVGGLVLVEWQDRTRSIAPIGVLVHTKHSGYGD